MKIDKNVGALLDVLNAMYKGLEKFDDEFCETDFHIGFGDVDADVYVGPESFEIFERSLANLICLAIEDAGLENVEPYTSLHEKYSKL